MTANAKVPAGAIPRRAAILAQHRDFPAFKALQSGQIWQFPRYSRLIWEYPAVEVLIRVPIKPESRLIKPNQGKSNQIKPNGPFVNPTELNRAAPLQSNRIKVN